MLFVALVLSNAVNVNFRMDAELKCNMEELCDDLGMSMTTAFTIFVKRMTRERRIPFDVSAENSVRCLGGSFLFREQYEILERNRKRCEGRQGAFHRARSLGG